MKKQDITLTPDRQGFLDLADKSVPQLKELLERQEKLLLKRKFLDSLPDKGEKTRTFAAYLRQLVDEKSNDLTSYPTELITGQPNLGQKPNLAENVRVSSNGDIIVDKDSPDVSVIRDDSAHSNISPTDMLESSSALSNISPTDMLDSSSALSNISPTDMLDSSSALSNISPTEMLDSSSALSNISPTEMLDSSSNIVLNLEKLSLGGSSQKSQVDTSLYINSYERVIKRMEAAPVNLRAKFLPFRTLHDDHIPASPYPHKTEPKKLEREELSAVRLPCYKYPSTKLISLEESVQLIQHQMTLNEELVSQRAARRLADQLIPKMDTYTPESTDMQYRETAETNQDSDDDDDASQDDDDDGY